MDPEQAVTEGLKVGRILYDERGRKVFPKPSSVSGSKWLRVEVMTKSTRYGALSPYLLRRPSDGALLENIWQFSKVYPCVPQVKMPYSRHDKRVIWEHGSEDHFDEASQSLLPAYFEWRSKGFAADDPIRYPVGHRARHGCLFSLDDEGAKRAAANPSAPVPVEERLGYVEARKAIYVPFYEEAVVNEPLFHKLVQRLASGEQLLICEVDGPHQESLDYYCETYGVGPDFIEDHCVTATRQNLDILLEDEKYPYGHGFCLARALLDAVENGFGATATTATATATTTTVGPEDLE